MMPVHMWWLNAGVAPVYRDYWLAVELRPASGSVERGRSVILRVPVDVRKWLPGDAVFDGTLYVPETLTPGIYSFRIGLLDPRTGEPSIRLAIRGHASDGWYDLGSIGVE